MTKRNKPLLFAAFLLAAVVVFQSAVFAIDGDTLVINADGEYTVTGTQLVVIDGANATVTLSGANIVSTGDTSAIIVKNGANVEFVIEGDNTISGNPDATTCGIEVEFGSSVTFGGTGTLNVTGGKWGAAIGSYGTTINIPEEQRRNVGEITINSGTIIAQAGARGSGIGSGYHVNGNLITINGGTIYAYGKECGAGIGSGYGTSGGAIGVAAVGEYDCGRIVINGGVIYASANYVPNIASFDYSDLATLNANDPCSFAAGIGGGYGSSASDIEINGGTIFALGSGGGAGIGAGRGTSKAAQYNAERYCANVKIGGGAYVVAVTADSRTNEINSAGAAIGSGRGSHTGGNIEIGGNATVIAISATQAPAIGASKQKSPVDGSIPVAESIVIGDGVTLYAASAGTYAVDKDAAVLSISPEYFGSSDNHFFGTDAVAIADMNDVNVASEYGDNGYTAPAGTVSVWANIVNSTPAGSGSAAGAGSDPVDTDPVETDPVDPEIPQGETGSIRIDVPLKMAVAFEDGSVYYGGEMKEIVFGQEYTFRMCSVNWDNGLYDEEGNGLAGTVVYRMVVVHRDEFKALAAEAAQDPDRYTVKGIDIIDNVEKKIIVDGDATDTHLETDVNNFFVAYRFHFTSSDYNRKTGIEGVVNTPVESLSVNLPAGTTVTCNAYFGDELLGTDFVYITTNSGEGVYDDVLLTSVNDYTWAY